MVLSKYYQKIISEFITKNFYDLFNILCYSKEIIFEEITKIMIIINTYTPTKMQLILQYTKNIIFYLIKLILILPLKYLIINVVNKIYPIKDIKSKFIEISNNDKIMTKKQWEIYIETLHNKEDKDYFDIIIISGIDKIKLALKTYFVCNKMKNYKIITYEKFVDILKLKLGSNSVELKYRETTNSLFVSIFNDKGKYRKLYYFDDY